jgi:hypothetical protein
MLGGRVWMRGDGKSMIALARRREGKIEVMQRYRVGILLLSSRVTHT